MKIEIKCPECKNEFKLTMPEAPKGLGPNFEQKMNMTVTLCPKCLTPLIRYNDADAWEEFTPEDLEKLPQELRSHVAGIMASKIAEMATKPKKKKEPKPPQYLHSHFFVAGNEAVAPHCIVLIYKEEWVPFSAITSSSDMESVGLALAFVATHDFEQNIIDN